MVLLRNLHSGCRSTGKKYKPFTMLLHTRKLNPASNPRVQMCKESPLMRCFHHKKRAIEGVHEERHAGSSCRKKRFHAR